MELPDAAAEGGCADNLRVEWNETRKKKSNQWSILKDRERNCLCLSFLPCQSSVDSRCVCLWSAKNRISSTCASIVSSKREIHRAIRHKNGERIERETLQILLNSPMTNSIILSNFSFDTSLPQKILFISSTRNPRIVTCIRIHILIWDTIYV